MLIKGIAVHFQKKTGIYEGDLKNRTKFRLCVCFGLSDKSNIGNSEPVIQRLMFRSSSVYLYHK